MDTNNLNNSSQRVVTGFGLLGAAIIIVAIDAFSGYHLLTWAVMGAILYFAFDEMTRLLGIEDGKTLLYYFAAPVWVVAYFYPRPEILTCAALLVLLSWMVYKNCVDYKLAFPLLYPLAPMLFIFALVQIYGIGYLVWLVVIVGITDTAAYYGGKSLGVTPFSPISPKKTEEGVFVGLIAGTFIGAFVGCMFDDIGFITAIIVSFVVSAAGVFGDLFESYIKRCAGVKDSGNILPGHGGMLDRADGYLFGAVAMVILLEVFIVGARAAL
jgi:phosphatidate cytidylyltransferase